MQVVGLGSFIFRETPLLSLAESNAPEETQVSLSLENKTRSGNSPSREVGFPLLSQALFQLILFERAQVYRK